ncbi:NACHT domain-containing protein [Micromonospora sp. NPDC048898]|uniref:NACHT domain-containing protein n=1 Tax=Micromonospora sp. NPDC048898 TaxID=3364260 RepID=UPI00371D174A
MRHAFGYWLSVVLAGVAVTLATLGDTAAGLFGLGAVALTMGVVQGLTVYLDRSRQEALSQATGPAAVEGAAAQVALDVHARLKMDWRDRFFDSRHPIPLRWEPADDRTDNLRLVGLRPDGASKQSDLWVGAPPAVRSAADAAGVLRAVPSGRLVVLGPPGAGKTTVALLLTSGLARDQSPGDSSVPVFLPLATLRATEDFQDWLVRQIKAISPVLADPARYGPNAVATMLETRRLVLVLDGLDEVPPERRVDVLAAINALPADASIVVTSRPEAYPRAGAIRGAAAVRLRPLTGEQVADHLSMLRPPDAYPRSWDALIAELVDEPEGALASALSTPLMLSLTVTTYSSGLADPARLLDRHELPDRAAIEGDLLDSLLSTAYRESPLKPRALSAADARRVFTFLARRLHNDDTRSFGWWNLHRLTPRPLFAAVAGALTALCCAALVTLPLWYLVAADVVPAAVVDDVITDVRRLGVGPAGGGGSDAVLVGYGVALLGGLVGGYAGGLVGGFGALSGRGRLDWPAGGGSARFLRRVGAGALIGGAVGLCVGLTAGGAVGLVAALAGGTEAPLLGALAGGLRGGLLGGVLGGLSGGLGFGRDLPEPWRPVSASKSTATPAARRGVVLGLTGVTVGVIADLRDGLGDPVTDGVVGGFFAGLALWLLLSSLTWADQRHEAVGETEGVDPSTALIIERRAVLEGVAGAVTAAALAYVAAGVFPLAPSWPAPLLALLGLAVCLQILVRSPWSWFQVARLLLAAQGRLPFAVIRVLDDGRRRGVLVHSGAGYRFRHARLQDRLAGHGPASGTPDTAPPTDTGQPALSVWTTMRSLDDITTTWAAALRAVAPSADLERVVADRVEVWQRLDTGMPGAAEHQQRVVAALTRLLGADHPFTVVESLTGLELQAREGSVRAAERQARATVAALERRQTDRALLVQARWALGRILTQAGKVEEAGDHLMSVRRAFGKLRPGEGPVPAGYDRLIADLHPIRSVIALRPGVPAEAAEDILTRQLAEERWALGDSHHCTLQTRRHLAQQLKRLGRYGPATQQLETALRQAPADSTSGKAIQEDLDRLRSGR